jgi:hypothetical protein
MPVYVDPLADRGWKLRGHAQANCHLFTDAWNLDELHAMAARIGMKREWFQDARSAPHYDVTPKRRALAVSMGVIEVSFRQACAIWRKRRALVAVLR